MRIYRLSRTLLLADDVNPGVVVDDAVHVLETLADIMQLTTVIHRAMSPYPVPLEGMIHRGNPHVPL